MAYSELVSLSACKSYSRTPGSMRKYAVCGSLVEHAGSMLKYAEACGCLRYVCGSMQEYVEVCGSTGEVRRKYAELCGRMREVCGKHGERMREHAGNMEKHD